MKAIHKQHIFLCHLSEQIRLRNLSQSTERIYIDNVSLFIKHHRGIKPKQITVKRITDYVLHLQSKKQKPGYINQQIASIKFFFKYVLKKKMAYDEIPRMKENRRYPKVISQEEIKKILDATTNLKHRMILSLLYSSGMRIHELRHLECRDILSKEGVIHIRHGKGGEQRYVMLSPEILKLLREYWKKDSSNKKSWLFPGVEGKKIARTDYISTIFRKARKRAGIKKKFQHIVFATALERIY